MCMSPGTTPTPHGCRRQSRAAAPTTPPLTTCHSLTADRQPPNAPAQPCACLPMRARPLPPPRPLIAPRSHGTPPHAHRTLAGMLAGDAHDTLHKRLQMTLLRHARDAPATRPRHAPHPRDTPATRPCRSSLRPPLSRARRATSWAGCCAQTRSGGGTATRPPWCGPPSSPPPTSPPCRAPCPPPPRSGTATSGCRSAPPASHTWAPSPTSGPPPVRRAAPPRRWPPAGAAERGAAPSRRSGRPSWHARRQRRPRCARRARTLCSGRCSARCASSGRRRRSCFCAAPPASRCPLGCGGPTRGLALSGRTPRAAACQ